MLGTVAVTLTILCNNYNYHYSPNCKPATFEQTPAGWRGTLVNGSPWTQEYITRDMMLFKGEDMKWLVYKDMVVYLD